MNETFDEAVERLRRETRLSKQIEELAGYVDKARRNVSRRLYLLSGEQLALLVGQLRELRGRRVAMQREPDDEVNAPADLACPCGQLEGNCDCDGVARRLSPDGWSGDDYEVVDSDTGRQLTTFCSSDSCQAARYGGSDLCGGCGACTRLQAEHSGHVVRRLQHDCDGAPAEAECRYLGGGECEPETCPVAPPDPEAIARRLIGELGPELAAAVCVQLLGRLPRREP